MNESPHPPAGSPAHQQQPPPQAPPHGQPAPAGYPAQAAYPHAHPQQQGSGSSKALWIVLIVVGVILLFGMVCVAAIAVPIYSTLVDEAKWTEAEAHAATTQSVLMVYFNMHSGAGELPMGTEMPYEQWGPIIDLEPSDLQGNYFSHEDVVLRLEPSPTGAPSYEIIVNGAGYGNNRSDAPAGRLILKDGEVTIED